MDTNIGKLTATLSETEQNKIEDLIEKLNRNIKPAIKLTADDVHIRCMYIVSEELNSYGGKFRLEELSRIKELIVDSPVLIGHKKDELPIGRNFYAEVVFKENSHWVKSYFYWMKSAENAEDLQKNIDGGIIKECSIGFTFLNPECSICGSDIRTCSHEPFCEYSKDGLSQSCYFYYNQIEKVLETSLVYRGAIPNTSISNELYDDKKNFHKKVFESISSLNEIRERSTFLLTPMYVSIDVICTVVKNQLSIQSIDNMVIPRDIVKKYFRDYPKNLKNHFGLLVGYRGKERCSLTELQKYLSGEKSIVKRVELRLFPTENVLKTDYQNIKLMRYKIAQHDEIDKFSNFIMTKDGIRIFSLQNQPPSHLGYLYHPNKETQQKKNLSNQEYCIIYDSNQNARLSIMDEKEEVHFLIKRFSQRGCVSGQKFVAEKILKEEISPVKHTLYNSGNINDIKNQNDSLILELDSYILNKIIIQPILLNGKEQYLFYKSA